MIKIRPAKERGLTKIDWLESYHTFSFGSYQDSEYTGFNSLRVINEDYLLAGGGFAEHPHKNMEILTYVVKGSLAHKDSLGNTSEIKANSAQLMSAGKGIRHSEFNASDSEPVHFLQIWITPEQPNTTPSYQEISVTQESTSDKITLLAARENAPLIIKQKVSIYIIKENALINHQLNGEHAWLQLINGTILINSIKCEAGDGVAIMGENSINVEIESLQAEYLLFHFHN